MMNGAAPFRSHLMQQFAASARTQSRPPVALFSFGSESSSINNTNDDESTARRVRHQSSAHTPRPTLPPQSLSSADSLSSIRDASFLRRHISSSSTKLSSIDEGSSTNEINEVQRGHISTELPISPTAIHFQQLISSRRTVSNFLSIPPSSSSNVTSDDAKQVLLDAIKRGVECASTAPNHRITEPTTFYRIVSPSKVYDQLLDIAHEVTLKRLRDNKLCGEEACQSEANRKREKWARIPAFVVVTVSGMYDQSDDTFGSFAELPYVAPGTVRQLEDYASACASVQNLLLSLHSEGLATKWATGPVVRTNAFRDLIRCQRDDMVVGLIMIGWPKRTPKLRRRRQVDGDVLRDVVE